MQKLPVIEQDKDDIKFTEQYVKATDLFIRSLENSQLGRIKKFRAIYRMTRHQQDVASKLSKAQLGDTQELEGILEKLRENFQSIMNEFFKLNPSLIEPTFKEIKKKQDILPSHDQDTPVRAEHYFRMLKEENPEKKEDPKEKVQLVRVVNKTSIPVKVVGSTLNNDMREERTVRKKWLSFLSFNERGRSSRSLFGGSSRGSHAVRGLMSGEGLVNLPNILSALLFNAFGSIISRFLSLTLAGVGLLARTFAGRIIALGVTFLTGVIENGLTKLVEWIFGEDSGIAKVVKDLFASDFWKSSMTGGAIGAGIGSLFGPTGMFWGFIIGSIAGLLKAWIDDDGPKKLKESSEKLWETITKGIDDLYNTIANSFTSFFGGIADYFRKVFKPNQAEQIDKLNKDIEDAKSTKEKNERILANPNTPKWAQYEAQRNIDESTEKIKKLEDQKTNVKPDSVVAREEDLERLRIMEERLKKPFRNEAGRLAYLQQFNELKTKLDSQPATTGLVKPPELPVTTNLYDNMIGQKRMDFMNSIPGIVNAPSNIMSSTNINNRTNNTTMMQLSPLNHGDRIN